MTTVKVWADFTCPYCYIAKHAFYQVVKDLDRLDLKLEVMSFELNPNQGSDEVRGLVDNLAASYGISLAEATEMAQTSEREVKAAGLPADFLKIRQSSTHDAHRLYHYALTQGLGMTFFDLAQQAYFVDGIVLSDRVSLLELAAAAGLEESAADQVLQSDAFAEAVKADHDRAVQKQIQYVPHFVWSDGSFSEGVLKYDDLKVALED